MYCLFAGSSGSGNHVHAAALAVEHDLAVHQSEQRVVIPLANALAGVEFGANLADNDVSCSDHFAAKFLDAASLGV